MRAAWLAVPLLMVTLSTGSLGVSAASEPTAGTLDWPVLKSLNGKVVLVDFWASWCGPCLKSFPWMNELHQRHAGEDLVIVAVNLDQERALADAFLQKLPAQFRVEFDPAGNIARQFDVQAMPTSFLIDRKGYVRIRHAGFKEKHRDEREKQIEQLLKEDAP